MLRFNTSFLLKATAVSALSCLPMALDKESGFVLTAFLLPVSLASLAAAEVGKHGEFEVKLKELPDSVVEVEATGGRQTQWVTRCRIVLAGACLSIAFGFPMLHLVEPGPIGLWLPLVVLFAAGAVLLVGHSARRRVLTEERQFVTEFLLFGRLCWWRCRWQVREGDTLGVFLCGEPNDTGIPNLLFWHALFVCRSRRRHFIAGMYTSDRVAPNIEIAGHRVADLVDLPYEGYRESTVFWLPF